MGLLGGGMVLYGLTQKAPTACVLGSVGLGLAAEGLINAGFDDLVSVSKKLACAASSAAGRVADSLGIGA
jgi:hypothetical protein